eukprot:scaffold50297_cov22-Tisochrysis_lutea.AAC.7
MWPTQECAMDTPAVKLIEKIRKHLKAFQWITDIMGNSRHEHPTQPAFTDLRVNSEDRSCLQYSKQHPAHQQQAAASFNTADRSPDLQVGSTGSSPLQHSNQQ